MIENRNAKYSHFIYLTYSRSPTQNNSYLNLITNILVEEGLNSTEKKNVVFSVNT